MRLIKPFPALNPLFFRILLYFLSLLLPIIIIGVVFYVNINNRLIDELTQKVQMNLQSSANTIEIYMRTAQETSMNIFYQKNLLILPYGEYKPEERVRMPEIPETLLRMSSNISALIETMFLYVDDVKVYTGAGADSFDDYFDRLFSFRKYNKDFWRSKLRTDKAIEILEVSEARLNNGVQKSVIPLVYMNTIHGHNVVLVTTISVETIQKTIETNAVIDSTIFVVTDNNGNIILNSGRSALAPAAIGRIGDGFYSRTSGHREMTVGGVPSIVNYVKSENYGWNYYSIMPVSDIKRQTGYLVTLMVAICSSLIVIGVLFSFIFTYNLYSPIKRIRDILLSSSEIDRQSAGSADKIDEFELIGKGIYQLIAYNHKFKSELEAISSEFLDQSLLHFIHGSPTPKQSELHNMLREHIRFEQEAYLCCSVRFGFKPAFYSDFQDTDRLIILDKIKRIIWGLFRPHIHAYVIEEHRHVYCCIVNMRKEESLARVKTALQHVLDAFHYDSQYCFIHIGIGKPYTGVSGIRRSYADAMYALEMAASGKDFQMSHVDDFPPAARHYRYSFMDENMILHHLQTGNSVSLLEKMNEVLEKNTRSGVYPMASSLLSEMYHTGCRYLAENGLHAQHFAGEEEHALLRNNVYPDVEEKKRQLIRFFEQIIERTAIRESGKSNSLIATIIQYIEDHYQRDLYLEKISDQMGVSAKYISKVFHEKTGVNLSGYISRYRISKAKELLLETNLPINVISERVGIYSRTTFIRLFKKYEGITPHEYRSLKNEQTNEIQKPGS